MRIELRTVENNNGNNVCDDGKIIIDDDYVRKIDFVISQRCIKIGGG